MKDAWFEWDDDKNSANIAKHGVDFAEAKEVFVDPLIAIIPDPDHSDDEERFIAIGRTRRHLLLVVIHVDRMERTRIISARRATIRERRSYEEGRQKE
jgi:uncharacterized DUF497 family protein